MMSGHSPSVEPDGVVSADADPKCDGKVAEDGDSSMGGIDPKGGTDPEGGIDPNEFKQSNDPNDEEVGAIEKEAKCVDLELARFLHAIHHPGGEADLIALLEKSTAVARATPEGKTKVWISEKA